MRKSDNKDFTSSSQDETSEQEVKITKEPTPKKFIGTKAEMAAEIERLNALLEEKEQELKNSKQPETSSGMSFPVDGDHDVDTWAEIWSVTPKRIREWVREYGIPIWGPSDKNFMINTGDFRSPFDKRKLE